MNPVQNVGDVFDALDSARAGAPAFVTNFFPVEAHLREWIERGQLRSAHAAGSAFFLKRERDYSRLYFAARDMPSLQCDVAALEAVKSERVVADIVGKEAALAAPVAALLAAGFRRRDRVIRMARGSGPVSPAPEGHPVAFAASTDSPAVMELLEATFDRFSEPLPDAAELGAAIAGDQVLICRIHGALAGVFYFERQGVTATGRFCVVAEPYRSARVFSALMRRYFEVHREAKRFLLWVAAGNANAVDKYRHYGFEPDGLLDEVLVNALVPHPDSIRQNRKR
ncbi:MAG: hypothetical protein K8T20_10945 [Planctomycetes bacterium]|nr:hypothetical protein [Planctomycetota bacterium]